MRTGLRAVVKGRVQGVGFRMFVVRSAHRLGLAGFTRNLPDGTVEVLATGDAGALHQLVSRLEQGPPGARVDAVVVDHTTHVPDCEGFVIR